MERNPSEAPGSMTTPAVGFLHDLSFADLPEPVVRQTQTCILDLLGVAAAGRRTRLSGIAHRHAIRYMAAGPQGRPPGCCSTAESRHPPERLSPVPRR
jgi:2-methylcitrate dehydratase PrpD